GRTTADMVGVHERGDDGLRSTGESDLTAHRRLLEELGGTYREVVGADVAAALVQAARAEHATQLVLGASHRSRWIELTRGSVVTAVVREAGRAFDVHVISSGEQTGEPLLPHVRRRLSPLTRRRRAAALAVGVLGLPLLTLVLEPFRHGLGFTSVALCYLLAVVLVATIGGMVPAGIAALAGFALLIWFFADPVRTFTISRSGDVIALVTFLVVAGVVSALVDLAARRQADAGRARGEAEALAGMAGSLLREGDPLPLLLANVVELFDLDGASVVRAGEVVARVGATGPASLTLPLGNDGQLLVVGEDLAGADRQILGAFADQLALALESRRLQAEAATAAALGQANELRSALLAAVSHDLRTPLGAIGAATETLDGLLAQEPRDGRLRTRVDVIRRAVERMNHLLVDLLDLASIDAGRLSLLPKLVRVDELMQEARETFEEQAAERGVRFETTVASHLPPLHCDRARLLQAMGNLITNALKFTPRGGMVRLRAELDSIEGAVRFTIADTGTGIAAEAQPRVFDRHWHTAQKQRQGSGLGLGIAKGIVEGHGGRIVLVSSSEAGSTFALSLPLAQRMASSAPEDAPSFAQHGGETGALIRAFDWSTTSLGPMSQWPQSLRTSVSTMLRSPYPITLFWGRDLVMLYNDPFKPIHGEKHPATMGASAHQALAEAWEVLGPLVAKVLASGEPVYVENGLVMFARRRGGLKEESYFTWSYNPTIGEDGKIAGLFAIASETTRQVVGDRRLATLRELSLRTAYDRKVQAVFASMDDVLALAGADIPFLLLYVVERDVARLVSSTGLTAGGSAAPLELKLDASSVWPVGRVAESRQEELVESLDARLGPLPGGPWSEPATRALLLHVPMGADAQMTGVLVAGLSPLLPFDEEYQSFLQLLARQISASIASARAYEQETQRAEKLAELDRAKTDFFGNVSHEFRTPLTLILGPVEDALAGPSRTLSGQQLELVRRNALRLYKMVNSLLDFSRVEAGRAEARFVATDLSALTASLASHFRSAAESAGLTLAVDCPPLPEPFFVDPEMWEKIVLNLLSNAVKYTHQGQVDVRLALRDDRVVVSVRDSGVGIAEAELPRVFERFYRVRETQGRSHEGTGIGLALARELVELHGGTLSVTSQLGVGSTFSVTLPRGSAHLPAARIEHSERPRSGAAAAAFVEEARRWSSDTAQIVNELVEPRTGVAETPLLMPSKLLSSRILLVDDNADLRAYVAALLTRVFANVETATHGSEALALARLQPPDLIVSDVTMPIMDGFALVRALRADERTRSVPIILLSARAGDESTVQGLGCGADDYLVKPFSARELMARVRVQLEMSRMRAEVWSERGHVEELRRSVAMRDEFISVSSHELRTPLTALQMQLESLLRLHDTGRLESDQARVAHKLSIALRQVGRLTQLVESLLDASRASLGALELDLSELDLATLARRVVARYESDARAVGSRFQVDATSTRGRWDERRLEQVLRGLLANAIKYAPNTVIELAVGGDAEHAQLSVRDRGLGIPADARARVFDRFERAVSTENYGGFGLGLYMSRKIVEAHGGTVEAAPTEGRGTTILVRLPRLPALSLARNS
ncbi:MAG: Sensor protein, partial [Myxococcaceae bacterium]|nr:Sensor protein [Myxococcaceae bacterium]